jgi:MFS transporter, PAT family, beta-lactamase induction signal transducer AmpG
MADCLGPSLLLMPNLRKPPAPWLFSLLILPLGIVIVGFNFTALPLLLAQAGVPVDRIASISSIINLPSVVGSLLAPVVDIKFRRRTWLVLASFGTALTACLYFPLIGASHLVLMTALILAGGLITFLVLAACGGLIVKTLSESAQSRAAAWIMAGQQSGGALGAALILWLALRVPLATVGVCVAALVAGLGLLAFTIPEPLPWPSTRFRDHILQVGKELWSVVHSPQRRWSTLLLFAPVSTGAAQTLLPAVASHYGVGTSGVIWMNGVAGGAMLGLGSLTGAVIPGDWDRRLTYAAAGLTNALAAIVLLVASRPSIYLAGTAFYLLTAGLCWARGIALMVEIVGAETRNASMLFGLLNAIATIPFLYMIRLDGLGFSRFGIHGLLWTDAGANLFVFAVVAVTFIVYGLRLRRVSDSDKG